jgi:Arc/MetJ family transcription regulator
MASSRTTLNIDTKLLRDAQELSGISGKTALIHEALRSLVQFEAGRRLAAAGGTMPDFELPPRRRIGRKR